MTSERHDEPAPAPQGHAGDAAGKPHADKPQQAARDAQDRREAEMAARSVMHPESYDREWRYYHGAWGG